jgi:pyruvate formate lyase activating enzyme
LFLGGLQKHSLIDFPGKVSCVCFLSGCNFKCPYCHNPDLVTAGDRRSGTSDHDFFSFLETRQGLLEGVVISGGEPTLDEHLPAICERVKGMGFSVKLDTNGSRPHVICGLMEKGLLDYVAMDIKTDPHGYAALMNRSSGPEPILESAQAIMASGVDYEFRTTCVRPFVDADILRRMAMMIQGAKRYVLQPFRSARILDPDYFHMQEPGYPPEEMRRLKAVAEEMVKQCFIRE